MTESATTVAPESGPSSSGSTRSSGQDVSSESLVTPELSAKFKEVFGGSDTHESMPKGPTAPRTGKGKPTAPPASKTGRTQPRQRYFEDQDQADFDEDEGKGTQADGTQQDEQQAASQQIPKRQGQVGQEGQQDGPTLSPVLRQAALRAKWDPEVIDQLWEQNPDLAESTFRQLHRSQNELSARFASLGANRNGNGQQHNHAPAQPQQAQQPPVIPAGSSPEEIGQLLTTIYGPLDKLNKKWDNAVPELLQPMIEKVLLPMQSQLQQAMSFINGQQRQNVAAEATQWFKGSAKDYSEMYGADGKFSQEQMQARATLAQQADAIRAGAELQGIQMTVTEALDCAHLMLAAPYLEEIERRKITAQIKKRSQSLTARPTQRRAPNEASSMGGDGNDKKSIQGAMAAYEERARALGIEV